MTHTTTRQPESPSKITQIQEHFRTQIRKGQLVAGDRLPPERQLANDFGVSLLTVNKAMAGLESEMLLDRQTSRGTFIHRNVSRGQIMVIFDTCHFANPELASFYHHLLEGLTDAVKSHGMRPTHILGHGKRGSEFIASLEPLSTIWSHASGVLAMAGLDHFQLTLKQMGVPVVSITSIDGQYLHPVNLDMSSVVIKAYQHLVDRGCQRIAILCNTQYIRGRSFLPNDKGQLCFKADLLTSLTNIPTSLIKLNCLSPQDGYQAMQSLCQSGESFDGLIVTNDNTAMGVGKAVREMGIQTPGQLKIVTHATQGVNMQFPLNFTRSQFTMNRICRGAFGLLYRLMLGLDNKQEVTIKAVIQQGATT